MILSKTNGFLFSQTVLQTEENAEKSFLSISSVQEDGISFILLMTTGNEIIRIANFDLALFEANLSAENTSTLMQIRDQIVIVTYNFQNYFTSLTSLCIVDVYVSVIIDIGKSISHSRWWYRRICSRSYGSIRFFQNHPQLHFR